MCRRTHALIPSFSVPCCSIGTKELDQFLFARFKGETVEQAGQCFVNAGMNPDYPESIHKRLKRYMRRIEFIFEPIEPPRCYAQLIFSLSDSESKPVEILNLLCFESNYNPVLFSRKNILDLHRNNPQTASSYNPPCESPPIPHRLS